MLLSSQQRLWLSLLLVFRAITLDKVDCNTSDGLFTVRHHSANGEWTVISETLVSLLDDCLLLCLADNTCRDVRVLTESPEEGSYRCQLLPWLNQSSINQHTWERVIFLEKCYFGPFGIKVADGTNFTDQGLSPSSHMTKMTVESGGILDGFQMEFDGLSSAYRGGYATPVGGLQTFTLQNGVYITRVTGNIFIDTGIGIAFMNGALTNVRFYTNIGTVHGPYGTFPTVGDAFEAQGNRLIAISGVESYGIPLVGHLTFIFEEC